VVLSTFAELVTGRKEEKQQTQQEKQFDVVLAAGQQQGPNSWDSGAEPQLK
jgi:hypothetical protein